MNKKLEAGAESFKQFVLDEYNQLFDQNENLKETISFTKQRLLNLENKHQDLTTLSLKLSDENDKLSKFKNDYSLVVNTALQTKLNELQKVNANLSVENNKLTGVNAELIKMLNMLGYGIQVVPVDKADKLNPEFLKQFVPVDKANKLNSEFLKQLLNKKYHVEEVKPDAAKKPENGVFTTKLLKELLTNGLKDFNYQVEANNEEAKALWKDLFGEPDVKKSAKRDNKGRFTSK